MSNRRSELEIVVLIKFFLLVSGFDKEEGVP